VTVDVDDVEDDVEDDVDDGTVEDDWEVVLDVDVVDDAWVSEITLVDELVGNKGLIEGTGRRTLKRFGSCLWLSATIAASK